MEISAIWVKLCVFIPIFLVTLVYALPVTHEYALPVTHVYALLDILSVRGIIKTRLSPFSRLRCVNLHDPCHPPTHISNMKPNSVKMKTVLTEYKIVSNKNVIRNKIRRKKKIHF